MVSETPDLHRVIVVGGGAGGLELVTRLGNKLGRYKRADVTLVDKCRAHAHLEKRSSQHGTSRSISSKLRTAYCQRYPNGCCAADHEAHRTACEAALRGQ
jgi:hypothetical protein